MKGNKKVNSLVLSSSAFILFLILVSFTASASPYAYITNMWSKNVTVIDTSTDTVIGSINVGYFPLGVVVNPEGTTAYVVNEEGTVSIIDISTGNVIGTVEIGGLTYGIAVTPDGKKVYVTDSSNVSVIDTSTDNISATVSTGDTPLGVAVAPDGKKVYVANWGSQDVVAVIDTATDRVVGTINVGYHPVGVAVSPDGTKVYVSNIREHFEGVIEGDDPILYIGTVSVIDTATNAVTATVKVGKEPSGIVVHPSGTKVYVANYGYSNVSIIDTATNNVIGTVEVGSNPNGVAVTPDGKKVYVANQGSNNVSVIDTATNKVTGSINVGNSPIAFGQFIGGKSIVPVSNFNVNTTQDITELTESDNESNICLKKGEVFHLLLEYRPSTAFSWQLNMSQGLTILSEKSVLYNLPLYYMDGVTGMSEIHIIKIKAISEGSQYIKGIFASGGGQYIAKTYDVNLTVSDENSSGSNVEQTTEQIQSQNNSGNGNTKIPDFEIATGIICLLSVFLYKRR